jgi:hypothetical protein
LAFVRKGEILPCCSIPITDIEIELPWVSQDTSGQCRH